MSAVALALVGIAAPPAQDPPVATEQASGVAVVLQAVSPVSETLAWISGHGGVVLRTEDGGELWERLAAPAGDSLQYRDVHAFSWRSAVVLSAGTGPASRIYRTDDGGGSWTLGFLMDHPDGFLDCLDFWDASRGFAYGDSFDGKPYVLLTEDGGATWVRASPEGLPDAGEGEGGFAASGTCARAGDGGQGWIGTGAGGSSRVLETRDYGRTWTAMEAPLAKGALAGVFTLAAAGGRLAMALGGDLDRRDSVTANAAVQGADGRWRKTVSAPVPGAVYGSAAAGDRVVAVGPPGAAYTTDAGARWHVLDGVSAWAVEFAPGGRVGWAAGGDGRVWRIEWPGGEDGAVALDSVVVRAERRRARDGRERGSARRMVTALDLAPAARTGLHLPGALARLIPGARLRGGRSQPGQLLCLELRNAVTLSQPGCLAPSVFLDNVRQANPLLTLNTLPVSDVRSVEVLSPGEAGARFGSAARYGVVVIETRSGGPAAPEPASGTFYRWTGETEAYPWGRTIALAVAANAAGLAAGYAAARSCLEFDGLSAHVYGARCGFLGNASSRLALMAAPQIGLGFAVRWSGATAASRGSAWKNAVAAAVFSAPGIVLAVAEEEDGFTGSEAAGLALAVLAAPVAAVVADRLFRRTRR